MKMIRRDESIRMRDQAMPLRYKTYVFDRAACDGCSAVDADGRDAQQSRRQPAIGLSRSRGNASSLRSRVLGRVVVPLLTSEAIRLVLRQ
ncbi:MAG: hypothetical protein ABI433_02990, partial [Burkholderiaceae bacterium]